MNGSGPSPPGMWTCQVMSTIMDGPIAGDLDQLIGMELTKPVGDSYADEFGAAYESVAKLTKAHCRTLI